MSNIEEICCLCLSNSSSVFSGLHSIDEYGKSYFSKLSASLTLVATKVKLNTNYILCKICCNKIDEIYTFNEVCLKSIDRISSLEPSVEENIEQPSCSFTVLKTNESDLSQNLVIKEERCISPAFEFIPMDSDDPETTTVNNRNSRIAENIFIKSEKMDDIESDNSFEQIPANFLQSEIDIKDESFGSEANITKPEINNEEITLQEALDIMEENGTLDVRAIYIEPPDVNVYSDDDSDLDTDFPDENESQGNVLLNQLSRRLLKSNAEIVISEEKCINTYENYKNQNYPVKKEDQETYSPLKKIKKLHWEKKNLKETPEVTPEPDYTAYRNQTPIQILESILDDQFYQLLITETDRYAMQHNIDLKVTQEELRVFIAILYLSGYNSVPNKRSYWENAQDVHNELVLNAMRRERFFQISKFIHFADNTDNTGGDKLWKIRPLINLLQERFISHFVPVKNLSYDECMVPCSSAKPLKVGYKMLCLNTPCGYLANFDIYQGKNPIHELSIAENLEALGEFPNLAPGEIGKEPLTNQKNVYVDSFDRNLGEYLNLAPEKWAPPVNKILNELGESPNTATGVPLESPEENLQEFLNLAQGVHPMIQIENELPKKKRKNSYGDNLNVCNIGESPNLALGKCAPSMIKMLNELPKNEWRYNLYLDKRFTNLDLIIFLKEMGYNATGTLREQNIPVDCPLETFEDPKELKRGICDFQLGNENVLIVKWVDSSVITIASTTDGLHPFTKISRYSKEQNQNITLTQPNIISVYKKNIVGTYRMDRNISLYRIGFRRKKWYWSLFTWLLDVAMHNAWILMKNSGTNISYLEFRRFVVQIYLMRYRNAIPSVVIERPVSKFNFITTRVSDDIRLDGKNHFVSPSKRRRCASPLCNKTVRTKCCKCDVGLCVECFMYFHLG